MFFTLKSKVGEMHTQKSVIGVGTRYLVQHKELTSNYAEVTCEDRFHMMYVPNRKEERQSEVQVRKLHYKKANKH